MSIDRRLSQKTMNRVKTFTVVMGAQIFLQLFSKQVTNAVIEPKGYEGPYIYEGEDYKYRSIQYGTYGYITEYTNEDLWCHSGFILPGFSMASTAVQGTAYFLILMYLFLGIALVADIFMEAIEKITSKMVKVKIPSAEGDIVIEKPIWNPTIANLTLMALGSSAPEIILSISEVAKDIEAEPGELGPMTIVGSASFNLMIISAVSIYAVTDVKFIFDLNVFAITAVASFWAYVWFYLVLSVISPNYVELWEALLTVGFMVILLVFAYAADRCTNKAVDLSKQEEENKKKYAKARLRILVEKYGMKSIVECALTSKDHSAGISMKENVEQDVRDLFMTLLDVKDFKDVGIERLIDCLTPDNLVERMAYRRQFSQVTTNKINFVSIKGSDLKGEAAIHHEKKNDCNQYVGFKHKKYEVAESNKFVSITIVKKIDEEMSVQFRTVDDNAIAGKDYIAKDEMILLKAKESERVIKIEIKNDAEWEPDKDFKVQLFGEDHLRLEGSDTECTVTILDDERPGTLGFESRFQNVRRKDQAAYLKVTRTSGSDGTVSCFVKTNAADPDSIEGIQAVPGSDYEEIDGQQIVFKPNEVEHTIQVNLPDSDETDEQVRSFQVVLYDPEPRGVKLSKKAICFVNIEPSAGNEELRKAEFERTKMIEYFIHNKTIPYSQQFKIACMLGPTIDQDNSMDDVTCGEAVMHLLTIFWKGIFSIIPPKEICGGWAAFLVALAIIGVITVIVGDIAGLIGCAIGLKESVTGITLVAMGTSLPDTFASKTAAQSSKNADSAIGNVTGSNSVNVFLGVGIPWVIGALHRHIKYESDYGVPAGSLSFSVVVFLSCSLATFFILILRRCLVGGELGGEGIQRPLSALIISCLWFIYIGLCSAEAYGAFSDDAAAE